MKKLIIGAALLAALGACSSLPEGDYGMPHLVKTSGGSRPSWIDGLQDWGDKHKGEHWFIGTSTRSDDETLAREDAKVSAMAQIADGIRDTVHSYFNAARTLDQTHQGDYSIETERAIESGTLSVSRAVVTGAKVDRYWWREYWIQPMEGAPREYYRDEYALVWMSKADYDKTLYDTLNGVQKEVNDPKAQHVLDFMKKHYLNDLNGHG